MAAPRSQFLARTILCASALSFLVPARADEIRLKDGKKLYGSIVSYEDNMFKVKTDFGYVLIEKDKIASIIPTAPSRAANAKAEPPAAKTAPERPEAAAAKPQPVAPPKQDATKPSVAVGSTSKSTAAKSAAPANTPQPAKTEKKPAQPATALVAPTHPASNREVSATPQPVAEKTPVKTPPTTSSNSNPPHNPSNENATATKNPATPAAAPNIPAPPPKPKPAEPVNREAVQGNEYINYTHGFRMYKPPSWKLITDAHQVLPNAVVAMGTSDESTLMVVSQERAQQSLDVVAAEVQNRLRDIYSNYRHISERKTVAAGFPAIEIHYRGLADDHDWSGTLMVVARGSQIFSILGMTYSGTDLIQIQENVIARAIASLEFTPN
jgi:hypothetical protein